MSASYQLRGCEKCPYTDKSRPYIQYGRLLTYYWHISKTSHIPEFPINRKREKNQNVTAFLRCRSQRPYERRRKGTTKKRDMQEKMKKNHRK